MYTFMKADEARAKTTENRENKKNQTIEDEMTALVAPCIERAIECCRMSCMFNTDKVSAYTREFLIENGYAVSVSDNTVTVSW